MTRRISVPTSHGTKREDNIVVRKFAGGPEQMKHQEPQCLTPTLMFFSFLLCSVASLPIVIAFFSLFSSALLDSPQFRSAEAS